MTTEMASLLPVVVPRMPAAKNEDCVPGVPMRMVPLSPEEPLLPIWMLLLLPPETLIAALLPMAILLLPVVLPAPVTLPPALRPMAVLLLPVLLALRALVPIAVLLFPIVLPA